jgi:hypothetical protein
VHLHYPGHDHTIAAGSLVVVDIGARSIALRR